MSEPLSNISETSRNRIHRASVTLIVIGGVGFAMLSVVTSDWVAALWGSVMTGYGILAWRYGPQPPVQVEWGMGALGILSIILVFAMLLA